MPENLKQAAEIIRYWRRLLDRGERITLEAAARQWIGRYAAQWREHYRTRQRREFSKASASA